MIKSLNHKKFNMYLAHMCMCTVYRSELFLLNKGQVYIIKCTFNMHGRANYHNVSSDWFILYSLELIHIESEQILDLIESCFE